MQRIRDILRTGEPDQTITVQGWVRTKRESKSFTFVEVNDGSSMAGLQVVLDANMEGYEDVVKPLTTGSSVEISGKLVESPGKGQRVELQGETVEIFGAADAETYPLQKKRHSFEFLRTLGHLRSRTNTLGAVFRVRNACAQAIHQFFQERGFMWMHTPIITASDCEGAGEMFAVTGLDLTKVPLTKEGLVDYTQDFFGKPAYLTVSGQLEAEIMAMAFTNVYTFGPTFRAENSNNLSPTWQNFGMVEPEMAFCDLVGTTMDLAEGKLPQVPVLPPGVGAVAPTIWSFFKQAQLGNDRPVLATADNINQTTTFERNQPIPKR